ncbi:MAG: AAA family ATPase [Acidobacteria bacterium]|nr:AAA family ATPase [Acidobacteriota bacterium]
MKPPSQQEQRYRLTASNVAAYFKHRCDRNFRWNTVEAVFRMKPGIGWNVPRRRHEHSRLGIRLLMEEGDRFEVGNVESYVETYGAAAVLTEGVEDEGGRRKVKDLKFERFVEAFAAPPFPQFVAQLEIVLQPEQEARLLGQFGLDPRRVKFGPARPDLLEVLPPAMEGGKARLRIWDFKASQKARHDHYIQVAYYSFLLDHAVRDAGLTSVEVDTEFGVICSREGTPPFDLRPYRLAVDDFLRNRAPSLFDTPSADAHFHVEDYCSMCEYMDSCRQEADAHFDLSRVAYISSESKRRLRAEGVRTHRELAVLADEGRIERLQASSHDLSVNLPRYVSAARALEDGLPRSLGATTLLMPRYEDVRVVLCAEHDAVTQTCFALGLKVYEGWDAENGKAKGSEQVFVAREKGGEAQILLDFLRALNELLRRVDAENREVAARPVDDHPAVAAAQAECDGADAALNDFKARCPRLTKTNSAYETLLAERAAIQERVKQSKAALKQAQREAAWELRKQQRRLHFYVYDTVDLNVLRSAVERHVFDEESAEMVEQVSHLVRLFPPSSILQDAETFRSVPGTVISQVLRSLVALPAPYTYDLTTVSKAYQPTDAEGEERGYTFRPRYGFGWEFTNQVAFERIHDVWSGKGYNPDPRNPERQLSAEGVYERIEETVRNKLRATDSVIRRLKQEFGDSLLLRKEPFLLYGEFDPLDFRLLEALRTFSLLETSFEELEVKHVHTLPVEDRVGKFVCVSGLRFIEGSEQPDGSMWFTFDAASRDVKFDAGEYNLVVTPERQPEVLLGDIDGRLFDRSFRAGDLKVTLVEYDLRGDPPRLRLLPDNPDKFKEKLDLTQPCVLDQLYVDYNSGRVMRVLRGLHENPQAAAHLHELLKGGMVEGWQPPVTAYAAAERRLRELIEASGDNPDGLLNEGQWAAWRGVFREPLTLIWGPPGTGKTHTVAHLLVGYALAALDAGRPLRILVTAATHHAIVNVLRKTAELAGAYGLGAASLTVAKLQGSSNPADEELPTSVGRVADAGLAGLLQSESPCVVVGGTVWSVYKGMKEAGALIQQWFDVVLVDEASQMKLPDALIAFSSSKANSNIILAGDDQQLPPIIHGSYPEEHGHMLNSVFAFVRHRIGEAAAEDPTVRGRTLFQLEENFRMNEPLTAYPRDVLYEGRFRSTKPEIRIATTEPIAFDSDDLIDLLLHPERPVVICHYAAPRSFTARNPVEAELVAALAEKLSHVLIDEKTEEVFTPREFARRALAVLSPHRAQNSAIRQALRELGFDTAAKPLPLVDTVEKLQGKERQVILVSYGVADEEYAEAEAEFLLSRNRFNVAATRAERKLVVFCSDTVLDLVPTDRRVLLESMMLKEFRHYCSDGKTLVPWASAEDGEILLNVQWKGFRAPAT